MARLAILGSLFMDLSDLDSCVGQVAICVYLQHPRLLDDRHSDVRQLIVIGSL